MSYTPLTPENVKDFPNFSYQEFACKCNGKYCNGFPVAFSYDLARNLQTIRDHFGKPLHITSPIRCTKWNELQGGVKNSKHLLGWACDFYINGVSYSTLEKYVKTLPYFHYCYRVKENQNVIHYDITPPEEDLIIQPVDRDENKDQIKTLATNEVRRFPSTDTDLRGYTKSNKIYNYKGTAINDGYTWYQIDDIQWVTSKNIEVLPRKDSGDVEELKRELETANEKIENLTTLNNALQEENKKLVDDLDKFRNVYTCEETGTYKFRIKLYKDESLYIK